MSLNAKQHLLKHICGQWAQKYWKSKQRFLNTDPNLVDWDTIKAAMTDMTISQNGGHQSLSLDSVQLERKWLRCNNENQQLAPTAERKSKPQPIYSSVSNHHPKQNGWST